MAHFFFKKNFCWWSQPEFKSKWCQKNICPIGLNKTKEGKWKNIKSKSKEKHLKVIYLTLVIEGSPWPIWETRSSLKEIYYFSRFKFWNQSLSLLFKGFLKQLEAVDRASDRFNEIHILLYSIPPFLTKNVLLPLPQVVN